MTKGNFERGNNKLYYEYDSKKYQVGYGLNGSLFIKRKKDDGGKHIFQEKVSNLIQVDKNDKTYFLVGSYYIGLYEINIYEDDNESEYLRHIKRFNMDGFYNLDDIRINEDTFIVNQYKKGGRIYTIGDESPTKFYEEIYNDKKVMKFLDSKNAKNVVLVDDEYSCIYENGTLIDRLTYGIDINTKKIVTPIWSTLKNKMIDTYTEKDVRDLKERMNANDNVEFDHYDYDFMKEDHTLEEITKYFEIERYFRNLDQYSNGTKGVYKERNTINKDFIMGFIPSPEPGIIMKKETIEIDGRTIDLEYDEKHYSIDHFIDKDNTYVIIKDIVSNKIVKVFKEPVSFIVQVIDEKQFESHFIVGICNEFDNCELRDYAEDSIDWPLHLMREYEIDDPNLSEVRLSEKSFKVNQGGDRIFTVGNRLLSDNYERIYNDKKVENVVGNNFVLVDQKLRIDKTNLEDMITYGIDPDTRKINTPIWSRLQNRLINIYSEEEIKKLKESKEEWNSTEFSALYLDDDKAKATMYFEVYSYLQKLSESTKPVDKVYLDSTGKVNKKFVNKFVPNNKE